MKAYIIVHLFDRKVKSLGEKPESQDENYGRKNCRDQRANAELARLGFRDGNGGRKRGHCQPAEQRPDNAGHQITGAQNSSGVKQAKTQSQNPSPN